MLEEKIVAEIRKEYNNTRISQTEIAKKFHISQCDIQQLLCGKKKAGGIKVSTLERMFPNMVVHLDGKCPTSEIKHIETSPKNLMLKSVEAYWTILTSDERGKILAMIEEMVESRPHCRQAGA